MKNAGLTIPLLEKFPPDTLRGRFQPLPVCIVDRKIDRTAHSHPEHFHFRFERIQFSFKGGVFHNFTDFGNCGVLPMYLIFCRFGLARAVDLEKDICHFLDLPVQLLELFLAQKAGELT
jgi:hypothetical protein